MLSNSTKFKTRLATGTKFGGATGTRTLDLFTASEAL